MKTFFAYIRKEDISDDMTLLQEFKYEYLVGFKCFSEQQALKFMTTCSFIIDSNGIVKKDITSHHYTDTKFIEYLKRKFPEEFL